MKIHEYQAKEIFKDYGIPVLSNRVISAPEEIESAIKGIGTSGPWVVKAQVHAGGRGKAGGVRICKTIDDAKAAAHDILSKPLVTKQTGSQGIKVRQLLVEEGCQIEKEFYLAALLDRSKAAVTLMASTEGGTEIEEVAEKTPEKILKVQVDPGTGFLPYQARALAYGLNLPKDFHKTFGKMISGIVRIFLEKDCSLVEINPLVLTKDRGMIALDAKMSFDENAIYRHPELEKYADPSQEDPRDLEAAKWNLNYIHLDGNIGCMVNGAGLAMATMDIIKLAGGEPANFLDVGGGASKEMVREAFKIIVSDPKVQGIFVNIFGGIMKCDVLAQGIVDAVAEVGLKLPLVVRLEGTNVEEGKRILKESKLNIQSAENMADGARLAVAAVGGSK